MKALTYVTGNASKVQEANEILAEYDIMILQQKVSLDEIQHTDILEIATDKAKKAFESIRKPLIVNDAGWNIPALNGFPGAYMKDVNDWFSPYDWLNLLSDKEDKTIIIREAVVFYDGKVLKSFIKETRGCFVNKPAGKSLSGIDKVISFLDSGMTVSEAFDANTISFEKSESIWHQCGKWLHEMESTGL